MPRAPLRPFDQQHGSLVEIIADAEKLHFFRARQAIEIEVIDLP